MNVHINAWYWCMKKSLKHADKTLMISQNNTCRLTGMLSKLKHLIEWCDARTV